MTLGFIEWVLFLGMVGLIWMMLDIFGDDQYTVDKWQGSGSLDHRNNRRRQPVQPSLTSEKQRVMVSLPVALIEPLR